MKRRHFITLVGAGAAAACTPVNKNKNNNNNSNAIDPLLKSSPVSGHFFYELPFSYDALEPYVDAKTMELHFDKHHRAYFKKFIAEINDSSLETISMRNIFAQVSKYSEGVRNFGGGYYNHTLYWNNLGKDKTKPSGRLLSRIVQDFHSFDNFKSAFGDAAKKQFGSGWAWLILNADHELQITATPNQDNPLMDIAPDKGIPLLTIDVWEHAYYLKYKNRRDQYMDVFWNIINWKTVSKRFEKALKGEWLG